MLVLIMEPPARGSCLLEEWPRTANLNAGPGRQGGAGGLSSRHRGAVTWFSDLGAKALGSSFVRKKALGVSDYARLFFHCMP